MHDDHRLLEAGGTPMERALLHAGASERPGRSEKQRALAALGLMYVAPPVAAAAPAVAAAGGTKLLVAKVAALVVALGVVGTVAAIRVAQNTPAPTGNEAPAAGVAATLASPPAAEPLPPVVEPEAEPGTPTTAPATRSTRGAAKRAAPQRSVREEVRALDRARAAIRNHESAAALNALDAYRARFPSGMLREEAAMLRVEALRALGERRAAAAAARRFERNYPASAHSRRVRAARQPTANE